MGNKYECELMLKGLCTRLYSDFGEKDWCGKYQCKYYQKYYQDIRKQFERGYNILKRS